MQYLTVAEARERTGLRLVLTAHVPGPWGEAAKAVLTARQVAFAPVAQEVFGDNDELHAWTGHRNAPIAMLDDDPPVSGWLDLLMLAERLGTGRSLLPEMSAERTLAIGLSAEICAPLGFGWQRRLLMLGSRFGGRNAPPETPQAVLSFCNRYGYDAAAAACAAARIADILNTLNAQLEKQLERGSEYFVGGRLSSIDLYWACFSNMIAPLPSEHAAMPEAVREGYAERDPVIDAALTPSLLQHRDMIYARHIGLPLDF